MREPCTCLPRSSPIAGRVTDVPIPAWPVGQPGHRGHRSRQIPVDWRGRRSVNSNACVLFGRVRQPRAVPATVAPGLGRIDGPALTRRVGKCRHPARGDRGRVDLGEHRHRRLRARMAFQILDPPQRRAGRSTWPLTSSRGEAGGPRSSTSHRGRLMRRRSRRPLLAAARGNSGPTSTI